MNLVARRGAQGAAFAIAMLAVAVARPAGAQGTVLQLSAQDQQNITTYLGASVVGQALPSDPITDASSYFPLTQRPPVFQVTSGNNAGNHAKSDGEISNRHAGFPFGRCPLALRATS
jgi:hypothetical protein